MRSPRQPADAAIHASLTTKEGWRWFVDDVPAPPALLSHPQREQLDPVERAGHHEHRLSYHARLIIVATPMIRQVVATGRRLVLLNRHQLSARRGLIVTGPAATGKTTAITQLGKHHELTVRRRDPTAHARLPVVYVTVPPAATPRMLAAEFARFLGLPLTRRLNQAEITNQVCDLLCQLHADLVLVDELHNLDLRTRSGAEASDQLKYLAERIPATFVYAGIDMERVGLFSGIRGRQIASRFTAVPTSPFAYGTRAQRQQWRALVATFEEGLRLHDHNPGSLLRLDRYLHQRTGGMIGSLSHLLRGAAVEAIGDGTEKITKATLDRIIIDHAAQTTTWPPSMRTRRRRQAG